MNPRVVISKLSAKTQSYGDALGGKSEMDHAMASGACAMMYRPHYVATRLIHLQDTSMIPEMVEILTEEARAYIKENNLNPPKMILFLEGLAHGAIQEAIHPGRIATKRARALASRVNYATFRKFEKIYNHLYETMIDFGHRGFEFIGHRTRDF